MNEFHPTDDQMLTVKNVAAQLEVSDETLRRWARAGRLVPVKIGARAVRYRRTDVQAFIAARAAG